MVSASNFKSVDDGKFTLSLNAFLPSHAVVPLEGNGKGTNEVLIKEGDFVKEGQVIAKTPDIYIHAPVSGTVKKIAGGMFSNGKKELCAEIALGGELVFTGKKQNETEWKNLEPSTLLYLLKEAGIVSTFERKFSLYSIVKNLKKKENLVLVVSFFDDDPAVLSSRFVSKSFTKEIVAGSMILARASSAKAVVFVQDKKNKVPLDEHISLFNSSFETVTGIKTFQAEVDLGKYPFGTKHNLVSVSKKSSDDEILKSLGKDDLFIDSLTALNVFKAIVFKKPEISTFVHVSGDCLNAAAIMDVKLGTPLSDVVKMCGGFKRKLSKIVINGRMKGLSVENLDIPVTKSMKSVEFVPVGKIKNNYSEICIRCGNCRKVCPAGLWPGNLYRIFHIGDRQNGLLDSKSISDTFVLCMECGLCNSVCPSRLPLQQSISLLKEMADDKKDTK